MENAEWLKSLSDRQLRDEIEWGKLIAKNGSHPQHAKKELEEALEEQKRRTEK